MHQSLELGHTRKGKWKKTTKNVQRATAASLPNRREPNHSAIKHEIETWTYSLRHKSYRELSRVKDHGRLFQGQFLNHIWAIYYKLASNLAKVSLWTNRVMTIICTLRAIATIYLSDHLCHSHFLHVQFFRLLPALHNSPLRNFSLP